MREKEERGGGRRGEEVEVLRRGSEHERILDPRWLFAAIQGSEGKQKTITRKVEIAGKRNYGSYGQTEQDSSRNTRY